VVDNDYWCSSSGQSKSKKQAGSHRTLSLNQSTHECWALLLEKQLLIFLLARYVTGSEGFLGRRTFNMGKSILAAEALR